MNRDACQMTTVRFDRLSLRSHASFQYIQNNLLSPGQDRDLLQGAVANLKAFQSHGLDVRALRAQILHLPRYRPHIQDEPDYFPVGHDKAESQYRITLEESTKNDQTLAFMFCGIGDARNLFQTILKFSLVEFSKPKREKKKQLHFTVLDLNPAIIARDLIFFSLLDEITEPNKQARPIVTTLSFLYSTHIIPPSAWNELQKTIRKLINALEQGEQPISWVHLPPTNNAAVCRVLHSWQQEPAEWYSTESIRREVTREIAEQGFNQGMMPGGDIGRRYPECKMDHELFNTFSFIPPSTKDPSACQGLRQHLEGYMANKSKGMPELKCTISQFLNEHWKPNVTLIHIDGETQQEYDTPEELDMSSSPFDVTADLAGEINSIPYIDGTPKRSVMDHRDHYFYMLAGSIQTLKKKMMVEIIFGEMADVMERIRYDSFESPREPPTAEAGSWPKDYHVIHLSNIPDYVGGALTSFLYGSPLLKHGPGTGLTSCVLRNPSEWRSMDQFLAEYLLIICSGEIATTARAPRAPVLKASDVDEAHTARTMSMAPWVAEFTTLVAVWQAFLPFGLLTKTPLPALDGVAKYTFNPPKFHARDLHVPHFMLVFWNQKGFGQPPRNLRPILLDDETGESSGRAKKIRTEAVHALTTFNWSTRLNTATFWLRVDVVNRMIREDWMVFIWRTDTWDKLTDGWLLSKISLTKTQWP
ncbi:hypothetical protein SLS62_000422 [Diatrype stigma]|uniref:DUF4470 domain-containing protein n=1 Tax=Diatrype stigma TaxID=117547 RepID=A0AAN9UXK2_9PEZI